MHPILAFLVLAQVGSSGVPGSVPAPAPTVQAAPAAAPAAPAAAPSAVAAQPAAQAPVAAPAPDVTAQPQQQGWWQTLIFFAVMILVFYLLIIRPQSKQRKQQETFLGSLQSGDKVVTSSGLIGRIVRISGNVVTLELARDVRVEVLKPHVQSKFSDEGESK